MVQKKEKIKNPKRLMERQVRTSLIHRVDQQMRLPKWEKGGVEMRAPLHLFSVFEKNGEVERQKIDFGLDGLQIKKKTCLFLKEYGECEAPGRILEE